MWAYFGLIRLAAMCGHRKAKQLVEGQRTISDKLDVVRQWDRDRGKVIWIHAASVGEFEQARPLIEYIRSVSPQHRIVLTFFSPSGYELRKNYDKADLVMYLPFATKNNAKLFLDAVRPDIAIMVKYEFWPAYLKELKHRAINTYIIAAIFRPGQLFFKPWGIPYRRLLTCFTHLFVQDEDSKQLLARYGIKQVTVCGDTRFDRVIAIAEQAKQIDPVRQFVSADIMGDRVTKQWKIIVAGSTWPGDEALLARYVEERDDVKLVLVPHEIDEEHLHNIFKQMKGQIVRYTQANEHNINCTRILMIDTVGMLSSIYRYAHVAYIGGGFGVGIHNTLEAAVYGVPVLFGPNYERFREAKGLIAAGAAISVNNYETFKRAMDETIDSRMSVMGQAARAYVEAERGATERIYQCLTK